MDEIEIPSYFLCPISLQIMKDPVTLPTGITYDRETIEQWIFSDNHLNCPVTKQPLLPDTDLIPNHTLRRLIQSWCALNNSSENGIERFPTPKPPVDKSEIARLLQAAKHPLSQLSSLRKIRSIVSESERNRRCVEQMPDAVVLLASVLAAEEKTSAIEALSILVSLALPEESIAEMTSTDIVAALTNTMQLSDPRARSDAAALLSRILRAAPPARLAGVNDDELFRQLVNLVNARVSLPTTRAALQALAALCPWGRNRVRAVNAGGVGAILELLVEEQDRRACEAGLVVLDRLAGCAEGREKVVGHPAGIAVVSKKILRVSNLGSERAVRVLHSVTVRSVPGVGVVQEMASVGAVAKLCLVLQVECGEKAKEKAREMLRVHARVWRNSPCLSSQFKNSYPLQ